MTKLVAVGGEKKLVRTGMFHNTLIIYLHKDIKYVSTREGEGIARSQNVSDKIRMWYSYKF